MFVNFPSVNNVFLLLTWNYYSASITFTPVVNFSAKVSPNGLNGSTPVDYQFKAGNKYVISFTRYSNTSTSYVFSENGTSIYSWSAQNGYVQTGTMISGIVIQD